MKQHSSSRRTQPTTAQTDVIEFAKLTPRELAAPYRLLGNANRGYALLNERTGEQQFVGNDWDHAVHQLRKANAVFAKNAKGA